MSRCLYRMRLRKVRLIFQIEKRHRAYTVALNATHASGLVGHPAAGFDLRRLRHVAVAVVIVVAAVSEVLSVPDSEDSYSSSCCT